MSAADFISPIYSESDGADKMVYGVVRTDCEFWNDLIDSIETYFLDTGMFELILN